MSEAARAALLILLIATTTIGAAWGYTAYTGPMADDPQYAEEDEGVFLITYRVEDWEYETETKEFDESGVLTFPDIPVLLQNVTKVEVTLQVATPGPAFNDEYEVLIRDPQGEERTGGHSVPFPQPEGYIRSANVISWARTLQPPAESYRTNDPSDAARWSAERKTDDSATGPWEGVITVNPPPLARTGNASLLLRFSWYEAVVLPNTPAPSPTPETATPRQNTSTNATEVPLFDVPPRTFITSRSVDGDR